MAGRKLFVVNEYASKASNTTGYYWSRILQRALQEHPGQTVLFSADTREGDYPAAKLIRLPRTAKGSGLISRVWTQALMATKILLSLLVLCRRGDVIISGSNPALQIPIIALARKLTGCRWVQVTFDLFPQNAQALQMIKTKAGYAVIARIYQWSYQAADAVLPVGDDMATIIAAMGVTRKKIKTVRNWAPPSAFNAPIHGAAAPDDRVVVQFLGNIGRAQGVNELLGVIDRVNNKELSFTFAGNGALEDVVSNFARSHSNTTYLGPIASHEATNLIDEADICLVSLAPGMKGLGVPSKFYFNLAADKYLLFLGDRGSEVWKLIEENPHIGRCFGHDETDEMVYFLDNFSREILSQSKKGERSRYAAIHHGEAAALAAYAEVMGRYLHRDKETAL